MSETSVSMASRRAVRVAVAAVVAVALLAPATFLFSRVRDASTTTLEFHRAERRGVEYLAPLTTLLGVTARAQSAAVQNRPVDTRSVRAAVAAVDEVDARLGGQLRTTERWAAIKRTVQDRISRGWPDPQAAYEQYSDLTTTLRELIGKVADVSNLVLDPQLGAHYLMDAAVVRIPDVLVDSGRYLDVAYLTTRRQDRDDVARLTAARDRIATDSEDLYAGLLRAFSAAGSATLAPRLTGLLDRFRAAVAQVAPSTSLLAQPPRRTTFDLLSDQDRLQRATLDLHGAALGELDRLVRQRESTAARTRVFALVAFVLVAVVVVGAALAFVLLLPDAAAEAEPDAPQAGAEDRRLVGAGSPGGSRAAR